MVTGIKLSLLLLVIVGLWSLPPTMGKKGDKKKPDAEEPSPVEEDVDDAPPEESEKAIDVKFALTARDLPAVRKLLRNVPKPFAEIEYYRSRDITKPRIFDSPVLPQTHNPEWPQIYHIKFIEGRGQRFKFIIKDEDKSEIGHAVSSLKDMYYKTLNGSSLEMELIGSGPKNGKLIISTLLPEKLDDDTDIRLTNKDKTLMVHVSKALKKVEDKKKDKKPKKEEKKEEEEDKDKEKGKEEKKGEEK